MLVPIIEIAIIAIALNYLLTFFWNTRSMDLAVGFLAFLFVAVVANWFHLPVLHKIMVNIVNVVVLAVLIIFQPELRLALSKLAVKGKKYREVAEFDHFLDDMIDSIYRLSEKRVGAIIVLENQDSLDEYADKAVKLNAAFSSELIESLFMTTTPLHDGAIIIRGMTVVSAATILPLSEDNNQLTKSMGTRHRAALGLSQITDALAIVISEETGKVSIARDGVMTRGVKPDRFRGIVRSIFNPPTDGKQFALLGWMKR